MKKTLFISTIFAGLIFSGCGAKFSHDTVVNEGGKDGLLNTNGELTVKPLYKNLKTFKGENDKYYHPNYVNIHWVHDSSDNSFAIVKGTNDKFGIIDRHGNLKLKMIYDHIGSFFNGFAKIELNGKYGFINEDFEVVLKPAYDEVQEFVYETAIVKEGKKYGCVDKNMELKIKPLFDMIYIQSEGFKRIELDDKWGFIDKNCDFVVKPVFDYAYDFRNGFAKVKNHNLWGFLDTEGKLLTKQIFDDPDRF